MTSRQILIGAALLACVTVAFAAGTGSVTPPIPGSQRANPIEPIGGRMSGAGPGPSGQLRPIGQSHTPKPKRARRQLPSTPTPTPTSPGLGKLAATSLLVQPGESLSVFAGPGAVEPGALLLRVDGDALRRATPVLIQVVVDPDRSFMPALFVLHD